MHHFLALALIWLLCGWEIETILFYVWLADVNPLKLIDIIGFPLSYQGTVRKRNNLKTSITLLDELPSMTTIVFSNKRQWCYVLDDCYVLDTENFIKVVPKNG